MGFLVTENAYQRLYSGDKPLALCSRATQEDFRMMNLHFSPRIYTESQRRPLCPRYIAPIRTETEEGLNEERVGVQLHERQFLCHDIMFQT